MQQAGLPVQPFNLVSDKSEIVPAALQLREEHPNCEFVVKAQILAGGRGAGHFDTGFQGGVHVTDDINVVEDVSSKMLGNKLITKQTSPEGVPVRKIMVCKSLDIHEEKYLAILLDRDSQGSVIVASPSGGMDIEQVAEETPELIFREQVKFSTGPTQDQLIGLATNLGFSENLVSQAASQINTLYGMFRDLDCTQIEINPLAIVTDPKSPNVVPSVLCIDAKLNFDDNAAFRQQKVFNLGRENIDEQDPREIQAEKADLNYIQLDGDIGCLVNGAGLALATCDLLTLHNGSPANFLDVGGSASVEQVTTAFNILQQSDNLKSVLVNIFGGIMRCDIIAEGIIEAQKRSKIDKPIIVRLEGTMADVGMKLIQDANIENISVAPGLDEAAKLAVELGNN